MNQALYSALYHLLKPLARILYRRNVSVGELQQVVKRAFVDTVEEELADAGERVTTSRIATITGLTRKDVAQLRSADAPSPASTQRYNRVARVIGGWLADEQFQDDQGQARPLELRANSGTFADLVGRYSGDMPARAMLDELLRLQLVERRGDDISLLTESFVADDEGEGLAILGRDVGLLIATIDHNINDLGNERLYQRKVSYDNLPQEALPDFRKFANRENQKLLIKLNAWLAEHDRDSNPTVSGSGRHLAGVGIYLFEEPLDEHQTSRNPDDE